MDGIGDELAGLVLLYVKSRNIEPIKAVKNAKAINPDIKFLLEGRELWVLLVFFEVALME